MPIILIIIGSLLIFLNYKAIKKDDNTFSNVLKYKKEDISEFEVKLGEIRKDMAESLTELQQEILEIRTNNSNKTISHKDNNVKLETINEIEYLLEVKEEVIDNISKKGKSERIKELLEMGLTEDEICEKLSIGKGEVLLVKGLFKK
jgi:hypothetical protein